MSVSTEVQRTLVKSPPELWSELSNPDALARHLSELGEIRITAVEPETKVEWEAEGAIGVVQLKQSGWGTKVTLSVTRTAAVEAPPSEPEAIAEPAVESEHEPEPEPTVAELEPEPTPVPELTPVPEPTAAKPASEVEPGPIAVEAEPIAPVEPDPEPSPVEPEPQLGFFARLFRKRKAKLVAVIEPEPEPEPEPETETKIEIEVVALAAPEPIYPEPPAESEVDLAAELASVEAQMTAETTELLTGVLDRLGAAHHRPFSRG